MMKLKIIIISVFSFFAFTVLPAQTIDETFKFANQQFQVGNYQQALIEFQRVAFFDSDNKYNEVYQKTGDCFYALRNFDRAIQNYNIAIRIADNDSLKTELTFKKVNCLFKQNNYLLALNELFVLSEPNSFYLRNKYNLFLATCYFGIGEYDDAMTHFNMLVPLQLNDEMTQIFSDYGKLRKRFRPEKIQTMSMFMPGLGQIYTGNVGKGINSFVLIGGIAFVTVVLWQTYGILDAFMSMSSWYYRYYTGGYKSAKDLAVHKLDHEKEEVYHSILRLVEENIETMR